MIIVDDIAIKKWGKVWFHMGSDRLDEAGERELIVFAVRLGPKPEWIQRNKGWPPHFDITASKRDLALRLGAKPVTAKEFVAIQRPDLAHLFLKKRPE